MVVFYYLTKGPSLLWQIRGIPFCDASKPLIAALPAAKTDGGRAGTRTLDPLIKSQKVLVLTQINAIKLSLIFCDYLTIIHRTKLNRNT